MHFCLEAGLLLSGSILRVWGDTAIEIKPGQLWWVNSWEPHGRRILKNGSVAVTFIFLPDALALAPGCGVDWLGPFRAPPESRPQFSTRSERKEATETARSVWRIVESGGFLSDVRGWLRFLDLMCMAQQGWSKRGTRNAGAPALSAPLAPAIELVRSRLPQRTSAVEAAHACHLSRSRFDVIFRDAFGVSFGQYERRLRLAGAADDIRNRLLPVKVAAHRWGFHDASHFCHAFAAIYRVPPSSLRGADGRAPDEGPALRHREKLQDDRAG